MMLFKNNNFSHTRFRLIGAFAFIFLTVKSQGQSPVPTFPKVAGYVGIVHPLVSFSDEGTSKNFDQAYTVGMPLGINIWKSPKVGFSLEIVPYIRATDSSSRTSNLLIHPGILWALGRGFTFAGRAAFETGGRYGFTPVINKVVIKNKNSSYFVAVPFPVRFGNDHPASLAVAFQFGIAF